MKKIAIAAIAALAISGTGAVAQQTAPGTTTAKIYRTSKTDIGTLLDDPAAKAVVEKHFPGLTTSPQIAMARSMTLATLRQFRPDQFTDQALADTDADLAKLSAK